MAKEPWTVDIKFGDDRVCQTMHYHGDAAKEFAKRMERLRRFYETSDRRPAVWNDPNRITGIQVWKSFNDGQPKVTYGEEFTY